MPHIETNGQLKIAWSGRSSRSRRSSLAGAQVVAVRGAVSQASKMLVRYLEQGSQTDVELALALGLSDGRISARRNGLIDRGLVAWKEDVIGPFGSPVGKYELTVKGLHVAGKLRSPQR